MFSLAHAVALANLIYKGTAYANLADNAASSPITNLRIHLHTADPGVGGTSATNRVAYTGYGNGVDVARGAGFAVSGAGVITLAADATFGKRTDNGAAVVATHFSVSRIDTSALIDVGVLGSRMGPFTATVADVLTVPGHSLAVDDRVAAYAASGSSLPTGVAEGTVYYVKTVSGNDITLSATQGGATLDITAVGDGILYKVTPLTIALNTTPVLEAASTAIYY